MPAPHPTPAEVVETGEQLEALAEIVGRLEARSRATFLLFTLDDYTSREIAAMQQTSLHTILGRIKRSRSAVSARMAEWVAQAAKVPVRRARLPR